MKIRQLEYFVAVADERNFTRAAEQVHMSPPDRQPGRHQGTGPAPKQPPAKRWARAAPGRR